MTCIICNFNLNGEKEQIRLRTGKHVCKKCISLKEGKIALIENQTIKLRGQKPPKNIWDIAAVVLTIPLFLISIYAFLYEFGVGIWISFICIIFGSWIHSLLSGSSNKKNEPFLNNIKREIEQLINEKATLQQELDLLYEQFWELPPDWPKRRDLVIKRDNGICQNCGRKKFGSKVPFHIHHRIPKSKREGNHNVNNLILLCEICHSKIDEPGHQLIKAAREKRLKSKYKK